MRLCRERFEGCSKTSAYTLLGKFTGENATNTCIALSASWLVAAVRLVAGVYALVILQVSYLDEALATRGALIRPVIGVYPLMSPQSRMAVKDLENDDISYTFVAASEQRRGND
jgi:hypothetical protein